MTDRWLETRDGVVDVRHIVALEIDHYRSGSYTVVIRLECGATYRSRDFEDYGQFRGRHGADDYIRKAQAMKDGCR